MSLLSRVSSRVLSLLLNLRVFLAVFTLCLCLAPVSLHWLATPNAWLFRAGAFFAPKPEPVNDIVRVTVSPQEMERFASDLSGAIELGRFIENLRSIYTLGALMVTEDIPSTENYAADVLVSHLVTDTAMRESLQQAGLLEELDSLNRRQEAFRALLHDKQVLLGVAQSDTPTIPLRYLRDSELLKTTAPSNGRRIKQALGWGMSAPTLLRHEAPGGLAAYPFYQGDTSSVAYPLLWRVGDHYYPDAVLALTKKVRGVQQLSGDTERLLLNDKVLALSAGALLYPVYSPATGLVDPVQTLDISSFRSATDYQRLYNKTVIIGAKDSVALDRVTAAFYSLQHQAYYVVPAWYPLAEKAGLYLLFVYLFWLLPLLRLKTGALLTGGLVLALFGLSISLQVSEARQWLPCGLWFVYLLTGYVIALAWIYHHQPGRAPATTRTNTRLPDRDRQGADTRGRREPKLRKETTSLDKTRLDKAAMEKTMALSRDELSLKQIGPYEIRGELGRGAMGVVYLGYDPKLDRKAAIKILRYSQFPHEQLDEMRERFLREGRAAARLQYQNIVSVYQADEADDFAYIAMEFAGGKPLSAYTKKGSLLPVDEVYWIIIQVAEAIGFAHERQIVHRDIKPSNILYDREREEVKVADFGIARIMDLASTRTGDILGSPLYMSPEQIKGEKVTGQSDIFSLGVTFYQLLTGELPFVGDSMVAITHQIVNGKFRDVRELNPGLPESASRIINIALQKMPDKRFSSAYDMSDMLQEYMGKH